MVSSRIPSMIERRPRAPVLRSMALRAMAPSASSASVRSIDSISNSRWYCFTSAFLGWVRMSLSEGSSRSSSVATTGRRPTNSGIRPYFKRSSGSTSRKISPALRSSGARTLALKPIEAFGERGRISHGEGHVEDARKSLRQQRLARAGWADQQDVRLRELDLVVLGLVVETLVVIMDRDREHLLGVILTDDIVVKNFANLLGSRNAVARLHQRGLVLLANDVHAQLDAFVADENGRAGDELAHLVLALAAERAVERILGIAAADFAHSISPSAGCRARKPAALQQTITGVFLRLRSTNTTHLHAF